MSNIDFRDRRIWGNIFIKYSDGYVLLNLFSFRRMKITEEELVLLLSSKKKAINQEILTIDEKLLLNKLLEKKQIIADDLLLAYRNTNRSNYESKLEKINVTINNITISPTFSCNFKCAYCYQKNFKHKEGTLSLDAIDNICKTLKLINNKKHYLEGIKCVNINGGEPLQEKNIEVLNYILKKFPSDSCYLHLYTNGYNINELKDRVDLSKFQEISISLDGLDIFMNKINGVEHSVSEKVLNGIKYIMGLNCRVIINSMMTKQLAENFDIFLSELNKIGCISNQKCVIQIGICVAFGTSTLDEKFLSLNEFIEVKKKLRQKNLPPNVYVESLSEINWIKKALFRKTNSQISPECNMCRILNNRSLHFAPNGKLYMCLAVDPEKGDIGTFYPNIEVNSETIHNYINKSIYVMKECSNCDFQYICMGGCALNSVVSTASYMEPFCGYFKKEEFWENLELLLL